MNTDIMGEPTGEIELDDLDFSVISPIPSILADDMKQLGGTEAISNDAEMSEFMDALVDELIEDYDASYEPIEGPTEPNDKWRYSSAYQKAVRRADPSIRAVAAALNKCDPAYIWRRGPTIALEDVNMGDPWVAILVTHACRFARVRKKHGPDVLAGFLGELMGYAVKDRLSCDSHCLPFFHPGLQDVRDAVDAMTPQERADLYRSDATPYAWRMAAGISLAGPRYGGDVFGGMGGSPELLAEAVEGLVPYPIQWLSRQYGKMARDCMFVGLPLVWRQLTAEAQTTVVEAELPERELIQGVLAATFDGHTADGRRALSYFSKSCSDIKAFFGDRQKTSKLLGLAVFTADSSLLDRYVMSPWAEKLYEENLRGEILGAKMDLDEFAELVGLVVKNMDKLNHARRKVTS